MFENTYVLLFLETVFAIYLLDKYYTIKNDREGNLYQEWKKRYEKESGNTREMEIPSVWFTRTNFHIKLSI
jgi:cytolysin (calcineurin-like family phosphatase)